MTADLHNISFNIPFLTNNLNTQTLRLAKYAEQCSASKWRSHYQSQQRRTGAFKTKELKRRPVPLRLAPKKQTPQSHTFKGTDKKKVESETFEVGGWAPLWAFGGFFSTRSSSPHAKNKDSPFGRFLSRLLLVVELKRAPHHEQGTSAVHKHTRLCVSAGTAAACFL